MKNLAAAMAKMQGELHGAKKDSDNPFFKSKYAGLQSVWEACRKPLSDNGLSVIQLVVGDADKPGVKTILLHSSGEMMSSAMYMVPDKKGPQAVGSCITYMRRYALAAVTGVYQEDSDAEGAMNREPKKERNTSAGSTRTKKEVSAVITEGQVNRFNAMARGKKVDTKSLLLGYGYENIEEVKKDDYQSVCNSLNNNDLPI